MLTLSIKMIEPKTPGGLELKKNYDLKIHCIQTSLESFPKSGPGSRASKIGALCSEYNSLLAEIENIFEEEKTLVMTEPSTIAGKQLKDRYQDKVNDVIFSCEKFPKSGPGSKDSQILIIKMRYEELLKKIEN